MLRARTVSITCIFTPVFNHEGRLIMTCSATSFVYQFERRRATAVAAELAVLGEMIGKVAPNL